MPFSFSEMSDKGYHINAGKYLFSMVADAASILPVTTALFQDYSGYSLQNSFEFRNDSLPSTSTLQKYNLKVNEQGTIDASECCGQINVHDYIPGLINVAMFARVVGIVRSKKVLHSGCFQSFWCLLFAMIIWTGFSFVYTVA